jgi:hypothetical protein
VLNYTQTPDWDEKARELTDDRGVDCVVEIGGPGTIAMSLKALAVGGHISPNRSTGLWHGSSSRCPDLNTGPTRRFLKRTALPARQRPGDLAYRLLMLLVPDLGKVAGELEQHALVRHDLPRTFFPDTFVKTGDRRAQSPGDLK